MAFKHKITENEIRVLNPAIYLQDSQKVKLATDRGFDIHAKKGNHRQKEAEGHFAPQKEEKEPFPISAGPTGPQTPTDTRQKWANVKNQALSSRQLNRNGRFKINTRHA